MSTSPDDARLQDSDAKTSSEIDPAQLIEDHQAGIWRYLRALGCEASEADDLTQETFTRVFARRKHYETVAKFSTFVWRIAVNLCCDELRRIGRRNAVAVWRNLRT